MEMTNEQQSNKQLDSTGIMLIDYSNKEDHE